jgi:hypothetical protein
MPEWHEVKLQYPSYQEVTSLSWCSSRRESDRLSIERRKVSHGAFSVVGGSTRCVCTLNTFNTMDYGYLNAIRVIVTFGEPGRCPLGRLTGSPLASAGRRHSTLIPGRRTHDRPPERPGFFHSPSGARRRFRPEGCQTSARALRLTMAASGGSLEVNPSVERTCLKDGQKPSILHGIVEKRVIGHFHCIFCLTCGARAVEWACFPRLPRSVLLSLRRFLRRKLPMRATRSWPHHHLCAALAGPTPGRALPRRGAPPPRRGASAGAAGARPRRARARAPQGHLACLPTPQGDRGVRLRTRRARSRRLPPRARPSLRKQRVECHPLASVPGDRLKTR